MRGIHSCCPEPVSEVTINQNIVEVDGTRAFWVEAYCTGAQYKATGYLPLAYVPYTRSQSLLVLNSGVQRQGTDFVVSNDRVNLTFAPQDADVIMFKYFALTDGTSNILNDSTLTTGMTVGFSGAVIPSGWLDMDGTTVYTVAAYPALAAWLAINTDYAESLDASNFVLKHISTPYYDGTTLVSGKTIIKT